VTTFAAWIWVAVQTRSRASPPREMSFVAPGAPPREHVVGHSAVIVQGERLWRFCDYDAGASQLGVCRYDPVRNVVDMRWPLPRPDDFLWAAAEERGGALVIATVHAVIRLREDGGIDQLGSDLGVPRGISVASGRIEVIAESGHGPQLHVLDGGNWITTDLATQAPQGDDPSGVRLEVAIPRSDGWHFVWSTYKQVFETTASGPPVTLGPAPPSSERRRKQLVDPSPGGVVSLGPEAPLEISKGKLVERPAPPADSTSTAGSGLVLGKDGVHALRSLTKRDDSTTTWIDGRWYTIVGANDGYAVGPEGAPGPASVSHMIGAPMLLPLAPRWILINSTGQYATLDTTYNRVDPLGFFDRIARMFTNYDHQDGLEPSSIVYQALALPIVLLGLPALLLAAMLPVALARRSQEIAAVIASFLYLIACGVWGAHFLELTRVL
jgi:hypothetical protein